jgi:hypothetical protein
MVLGIHLGTVFNQNCDVDCSVCAYGSHMQHIPREWEIPKSVPITKVMNEHVPNHNKDLPFCLQR